MHTPDSIPAWLRTWHTAWSDAAPLWTREHSWWFAAPLIALAAARAPFATLAAGAVLLAALGRVTDQDAVAPTLLGLVAGAAGAQGATMAASRTSSRAAARAAWLVLGRAPHISLVDWRRRFQQGLTTRRAALDAVLRPDRRLDSSSAIGALGMPGAPFLLAYSAFEVLWALAFGGACLMAAAFLVPRAHASLGIVGAAAVFFLLWKAVVYGTLLFTWTGRQIIKARLARLVMHEHWPPVLFYLPLVPYMVYLSIRHRHPIAFTACNPGIEAGGGLVGESKHNILRALAAGNGMLLAAERIETGPVEERIRAARHAMASSACLSSFPVILKPDSGFRGFAVRLARSPEDVDSYLAGMSRAAIVQQYHPGPHEVGVSWSRRPRDRSGRLTPCGGKDSAGTGNGREGFIYSITRKDFPYITGNGTSTLEQLIYAHPRYRRQAPVFLSRFADDASRILGRGETIRLAEAGNHCQGTLFRDGEDLITDELANVIDTLARSLLQPDGRGGMVEGGLDFGRFDLRFESEEDLRAGRNFAIVELNGTTGESTNLYDPQRSILWSYRVLFGQWRLLYELGAQRRAEGAKTVEVGELLRSIWAHYRARPGSAISD